MASIIKRLWSGSDFWDKEENKQQRQQYAAPRPQPEMEQKIKTARYGVLANNPQRQQQFIQDTKATPGPSILSTVHNTINDTLNANTQADQQRRLSQGLPRYYQDQSNLSKITRAAETGGRVTARVLQGIGQDTLGAYDLLTPGHGTNRATKYYQNRGKETDQEVKDMGLDENVYKAGQVPLALGSYMIPGKAVSSAAKATQIAKVPQVVKLAGTLNKVPGVTKTIGALDDLAANGTRLERVASRLARSYTRPGNIADVGVDALQNAGHRTSLGQDNSAGTLALDVGMSLGMQGGMNLAGQGASAGIRAANAGIVQPTTRLVRNVTNTVAPVQTTTKLIPRTGRLDLATSDALKAYNNMLVGADPNIQGKVQSDLIARIQQIGKENGVDLTNGSVEQRMARVEAMLNGYLPQAQTGRQFVGKPLGEASGSVPIGSPLIPIPKKLQNKLSGADPLESLRQEAKKYKSAEEFVKAQGEPLYHGSPNHKIIRKEGFKSNPNGNNLLGEGVYMTRHRAKAENYSLPSDLPRGTTITPEMRSAGVVEGYIPKGSKIYQPETRAELKNISTKELQQQGFDGIEINGETVIFDQSKIKTREQLTDLYNQSQPKKKRGIKPLNDGGYAKNPFYRGDDVAGGLSKEQSEFINDYANMLEGMGAGNGVDITPDGRRISNNVRDASTAGKTMSKQDWFEKARKDIESGKAGFGASDEYKKLAGAKSDPLESLKQEARKYKSAEEFKYTLGKLYRGGEPLDVSKIGSSGLPMTTSEKVAQYYRGGKKNGVIEQYFIDPNAKIKPVDGKNTKTESDRFTALAKAEKEGYDGINLVGGAESEFRMSNNSKLLTEKQLTNLYNQATQPPKSTPAPKAPKPVEKTPTYYHGTRADNDFDKFDFKKSGTSIAGDYGNNVHQGNVAYFTKNKDSASIFAREATDRYDMGVDFENFIKRKTHIKDGNVLEFKPAKDAKIKKLDHRPDLAETNKLKQQGYDGVEFDDKEAWTGFSDGRWRVPEDTTTVAVWNTDKLERVKATQPPKSTPAPQAPKPVEKTFDTPNVKPAYLETTLSKQEYLELGITDANLKQAEIMANDYIGRVDKAKSKAEVERIANKGYAQLGEYPGGMSFQKSLADAEVYRKQHLRDTGVEPSGVNPTRPHIPPAETAAEQAARGQAEFERLWKEAGLHTAPQPTKKTTPFEKDLQAVGLAPSPQAKGSVGTPSRSTPKKPQRLEVPSDQTTELPRLRQSKANPANQPSNRNEVLSKETPVNAVDSTTNTKNTKPGLESRTPKKSLKTPQEKPVVSGTSRKLSTPEVKQPQNLQQPSTTASAGVGGQAVSKTQPEAYKQPKESQVSQNQVQSQESSSKTRGFIKSVLEDPNTNPKVKESISSLYTVRNTKELQTKAATLVKEHPDIAEQMSKSANDDASVAVAMELVKKHQNAGDYTRAIDLVESVAKDLTEAGRTVQAASIYGRLTPEGILRFTQKEINNYNKATGKDIKLTPKAADTLKTMADDLQKMPDGYDKDVAVAKMIAEVQKTMPATTAEKISTFQTMAQLLNPKTIIRNELGNSAFLGLENISQTVATPVDALMSLFTGKRTTTLPSVKTQVKGLIEGRKKGVSEAFQGINTGASTQYDLNSVPVFRGKVLGNLEKTMGAALRGGDRANYTAAFDDSLKGSMKLAKTKTATPEMLEAAHHAGLYRTFQDQNVISNFFVGMKKTLNTVGIGIKGKRFGLGDMVLKYPKTPANLLARGIDYSPAGFVKTVFEMSKPLFGKQFDQKVFVDSLSRATTGTAGLVGTGAMLGSLGIITEAPEKDKDLRDLQKQSGLGGYQINVSGLKRFVASGFSKDAAKLREGDKLVSYDWAQPAAIPVSMGAAIGKGKGAKEGAGKSVSALTEGIQTITEQPMVRGLQQFFGSNKGAGGIVGDLLKDTPASFIPTLSNQVRQLTDNTNRNTYDPSVLTESMNRVKNKIPGLASSVPARIGSLGETRENYQNGSNNPFNVFFNPSFVSNYDPKETAKLPLGINQRTGEVKQAPRSISTTQTVNGKSVKITAQQNQDLQKYVGTETDKAFSQLMKNPAFMALSDEEKANKMGTLITNINKAGKVLILGDEGYGTDSYKPTKLDRGVRDVLGGKYDYSTRSMKTGAASPDYAQQYADLKADFNDPSNGWSDVQKVAKTKELKRLEIKKDYDADTVALHDMSKADMYAYVSKAKNGKQLAEKLIAYDNALYEAGLSQYRKYKNGIAPASKGGGRKSGGRGGKRKAIPKDLMAKAMDVPKVAQLRQSKITAKQPQARSFKTRRKAIPKIAKSTPKLTVKRTQTA